MIPVILSGGSGTRLWPVSRAAFPKQFCELFDESLMLKTYRRLATLGRPRVLTVEKLSTVTFKSLQFAKLQPEEVLLEPMARNTAPAVAFLCRLLEIQNVSLQTVIGLFPADAYIENETRFLEIVKMAEKAASASNRVVTLGIQPTYPATGYGYIEASPEIYLEEGAHRILHASGFREKPNLTTAQSFLAQKNFFWNAGMFIFPLGRMISEFQKQMPETWNAFKNLRSDLSNLSEIYQSLPSQSLDYGIMEGLKDILVAPADVGWSDVGSWDEFLGLQSQAGAVDSRIVNVDSDKTAIFSKEKKIYSFIGVNDIELIDTTDATLVVKKGQSQKVKQVLDELAAKKDPRASQHSFEIRPWGRFDVLADRDDFKSKVIEVDPGQQLSYQSHNKRAEHWIIVEGKGEVVLNDKVVPVQAGSYVFIPLNAKHRMRNTGDKPLRFVEVQTGSYFGEDDIVRYQDDYKRV